MTKVLDTHCVVECTGNAGQMCGGIQTKYERYFGAHKVFGPDVVELQLTLSQKWVKAEFNSI